MTTSIEKSNNSGRTIAIVAMFFLFAMISFVTNLAAPIGTIWGYRFEGNNFLGMLGNMMNFLAYLIMGIPAGKLLLKIGYKKTALLAMIIGAVGLVVQWVSGLFEGGVIYSSTKYVKEFIDGDQFEVQRNFEVMFNFLIYLLGAFIAGFCVCMLNTVVNPMLNLLGGGGNRGNQLIQTGGAMNSLAGTIAPMLVGSIIGQLSRESSISNVAPLLWIGIGIFIAAFIVISFVKIPEPNLRDSGKKVKYSHSPWNFRHTVLGVIAIFFYVGIEVGIPSTLNFFLADQSEKGAGVVGDASAIAGVVVGLYWLLMLVGRFTSSLISNKISTRTQLVSVTSICIILVGIAIFTSKESTMNIPKFVYDKEQNIRSTLLNAKMPTNEIDAFLASPTIEKLDAYSSVENVTLKDGSTKEKRIINGSETQPYYLVEAQSNPLGIPYSALFLILCGLCTSVMWGGIFNLAVEGLGKYTEQASGIFMMMVVGGGVLPLLQQLLADNVGYMNSYYLVIGGVGYIFLYAVWGCINVNKDIPVDLDDDEKNIKDEIELVD